MPAHARSAKHTEQRAAMAAQAPQQQHQQSQLDWASLLPDVLQRCLAEVDPKRAPLAACKRFASAVLLCTLDQEAPARMRLAVDRAELFGPSAKLLQSLVGAQQQRGVTLELFCSSFDKSSPGRCLSELQACGEVLSCITHLHLTGLTLETLVPGGLRALLPNLRHLHVSSCRITQAATAASVKNAFRSLQHVEVQGLTAAPRTNLTTEVLHLAAVPSLTGLGLLDASLPATLLAPFTTRLTALRLDGSHRQVQPGTQAPTDTWRATLQQVAQCTRLQSLTVPCFTGEELVVLTPTLTALRRLHLNAPLQAVDVPGDGMVVRLLGLPHLTSLRWDTAYTAALQRFHASSPCTWRELRFRYVDVRQLARLPLHSLTSRVVWSTLVITEAATVAEVQAAVDHVARSCPGGPVWKSPDTSVWPTLQFMPAPGGRTFRQGAGAGNTPAALLRAMKPLLAGPGLTRLAIMGLAWDVELVQVLGQVLPRTCVGLCLNSGALAPSACVQLARSLPWLEELWLGSLVVLPAHAVTACMGGFLCHPDALLPSGQPRLRALRVVKPACPAGVTQEAHMATWEDVRAAVLALGAGAQFHLSW